MARQYTRAEVRERIDAEIAAKRFVLMQGAGIGLVARLVEQSGIDLIAVYNTGYYRMNGVASIYGTLPIGNANDVVLKLADQIMPVVKETPLIGGVYAHDPTRSQDQSLQALKAAGFSGVINVPTIGRIDGTYHRDLESVGIAFSREVDLMRRAMEHDLYTVAYVYNAREAVLMAEAGVDMLVGHVGLTGGGDVGAPGAISMEAAIAEFNEIFDAVGAVRDDVALLSHGGPVISPEDAAHVSAHTAAVGFVGASSIERIPVEHAIKDVTTRFKEIKLR
ncbi:phosphoenolpyruvate hydrolase family protein [Paracoccus sp. SCSIO 75233]|uniref:phosphoenolpyruvate hydrolase family protein n=1 Tax=Paracoccus sp. SCSIO 75233 TaxID=3017782 RepID=UPI0022F09B42|nr:phosphoenolpyruvate hydrolase family protein [Paracoccus sp. SCSIO 75233]WBU52039.1 phosphoenolpyruvate hydrolase family protein [Paracoccus sp. SCSIO 75233]